MTLPTDAEIALVAAKLTKAQRGQILSGHLQGGEWCVYWSGARSTMQSLIRKGLVRERVGLADCLSEAGLRVRAHLERAQGEDSRDV